MQKYKYLERDSRYGVAYGDPVVCEEGWELCNIFDRKQEMGLGIYISYEIRVYRKESSV